jgi:hypothetical protein
MIFLEICDSKLCCYHDRQENESSERTLSWSVEIGDILLIAEYTTNEGPFCDDYFLVFLTKHYIYQCSFYAEGTNTIIEKLSKIFNRQLQPRLCNFTDWKSSVIWPIQFEGNEYFEFNEVVPNSNLSKIRKLVLGSQLEYKIAQPIRKFLESTRSELVDLLETESRVIR